MCGIINVFFVVLFLSFKVLSGFGSLTENFSFEVVFISCVKLRITRYSFGLELLGPFHAVFPGK